MANACDRVGSTVRVPAAGGEYCCLPYVLGVHPQLSKSLRYDGPGSTQSFSHCAVAISDHRRTFNFCLSGPCGGAQHFGFFIAMAATVRSTQLWYRHTKPFVLLALGMGHEHWSWITAAGLSPESSSRAGHARTRLVMTWVVWFQRWYILSVRAWTPRTWSMFLMMMMMPW